MRINRKSRNRVNRGISKLPVFHETPGLALSAVTSVMETEGLWIGMVWVPKSGTIRVPVMQGNPDTSDDQEISNSFLIVQTHEMPSGRIELTSYLS